MIIKITNLNISYDNKLILENINLQFAKGSRVSILGKNGSGKTTFVESISGCRKYKGKIEIDLNYSNNIRQVFQDFVFDYDLNLKDIFKYYSLLMKVKKQDIDYSIFTKYDLEKQKLKKYQNLSGGQKQKFKLLMALEMNPKILIVDEITTSLDYEWRVKIINILKAFLDKNPDCVFLMVSHNFNEIKKLTNEFYLVENQKIEKINSIDDFENKWKEENEI